jgi:copper transport protein
VLAAFRPGAAAPLVIHIHSEHAMFQVLVSPGTVGTDSFVLQLMSGDGNLLRVNKATLVLSLPGRGIEPLHCKATLGTDGYWYVDDVPVPSAGRWHLRIDAPTGLPEDHLGTRFRGASAVKAPEGFSSVPRVVA